jgi:hypothetical protein
MMSVFISKVAVAKNTNYNFVSIVGLAEQEIARVILPQIYQRINQSISITPFQ